MQQRPQYLNLSVPAHRDDVEQGIVRRSDRRLWWLLVGLALLSLFLIGMAMWWAL